MRYEASDLVLRIATAFAFLYPAVDAFLNPFSWVSFIPGFIRDVFPQWVLLYGFGFIQIAIAVWILSGRKIFGPSVAATAILVLIVLFNLSDFELLFRDLALAGMTLALAIMHRPLKKTVVASL